MPRRADKPRYPLLQSPNPLTRLERSILHFSQRFHAPSLGVVGVHAQHLIHRQQAIQPITVRLSLPVPQFR